MPWKTPQKTQNYESAGTFPACFAVVQVVREAADFMMFTLEKAKDAPAGSVRAALAEVVSGRWSMSVNRDSAVTNASR
jgi:hypothetical protein